MSILLGVSAFSIVSFIDSLYVCQYYICMCLHNMAMPKYNSLQGQSGDLPSTVAISSIVGSCGLPMGVLEHGPSRQHDPSLCFWCTVSMHDLTLQLKILNWNGPSWHKNGSKKNKTPSRGTYGIHGYSPTAGGGTPSTVVNPLLASFRPSITWHPSILQLHGFGRRFPYASCTSAWTSFRYIMASVISALAEAKVL